MNYKSVLVLMPDKHMGNLVVSVPAIAAIRSLYPHSRISLVVDLAYADIASAIEGIDRLIPYPRARLRDSDLFERARLFMSFIQEVRAQKAEMAIDLEGRNVSSTITFLSGAKVRVGRASARRSSVYTRKVQLSEDTHKVSNYSEIVENLGGWCVFDKAGLWANKEMRASLMKKLKAKDIEPGTPIAAIHAGAGKAYKQWGSEGFSKVADQLVEDGLMVILIGGPDDIEITADVRELMKQPSLSLPGRLSIGELMALFTEVSIYVGNDSGPMHLASAMGAPVIGIFGPADEERWRPIARNSVALRGEEPCEACTRNACELGFRCIRSLKAEDVISAARGLLSSQGKNKGDDAGD